MLLRKQAVRHRDLMKKGLRHTSLSKADIHYVRHRDLMKKGLRPSMERLCMANEVRHRDLMKKGLRHMKMSLPLTLRGSAQRPDEEGIKTSPVLQRVHNCLFGTET